MIVLRFVALLIRTKRKQITLNGEYVKMRERKRYRGKAVAITERQPAMPNSQCNTTTTKRKSVENSTSNPRK